MGERTETRLERVLGERTCKSCGRPVWTRDRLAAAMGVSRQALHNWMSGKRPWPADRRTQVAALLKLDRDWLFEEAE